MRRSQKTKILCELIESHRFNVYRRESTGILELGIPLNQDEVIWQRFADTNTQKEDRNLCLSLVLKAKQKSQLI